MAVEPVAPTKPKPHRRELTGRHLTVVFLVIVLTLLVLQVGGIDGIDGNVDVTTVILVALAIVLGFAALAPNEAREILNRLTSLKFGAFEIGLQAAARVERVQSRVAELVEDVNQNDDVQASTPRPVGGSAAEEFEVVRDKLKERLRYVRDVVLELDEDSNSIQTAGAIADKRLLEPDELQVVRDLLGDAEEEVDKLTAEIRKKYLDGAWRFASRFGSLIFERRVRKKMIDSNWFLVDFNQSRSHRPDFLAYRSDIWLLVAARVEPNLTEETRKRLAEQTVPFNARPVILHPDKRPAEVKDKYVSVGFVPFSHIDLYGL